MGTMTKSKTVDIIDKLNPKCGLIGLMTLLGCGADVYFTDKYEWHPLYFGAVFVGIIVPSKAIKIFEGIVQARFGGKRS